MLFPPRRPLAPFLWLAVAGLGGATLLALLGRFHWLCDLFTHFPLQVAAGLAVTALAGLLLRLWRPALAALACLLPNLLALSYYFPAHRPATGPPDFQVISFNVLTSNDAFEAVLGYLAASDADMILLMETDRNWLAALAPLQAKYPYLVKAPRGDNFGMAFFSRHPIESHEFFSVEGSRVPCVQALVSLHGKSVHVIGGHPVPPVGAPGAASRNAYLQSLAGLAARSDRPTVVLGDFNATVWSPFFRDFIETTSLQDTGHKRGFQSTWNRYHPLFSIGIDHILHSRDLACTGRQIGPSLGSDHRPVSAAFAFR